MITLSEPRIAHFSCFDARVEFVSCIKVLICLELICDMLKRICSENENENKAKHFPAKTSHTRGKFRNVNMHVLLNAIRIVKTTGYFDITALVCLFVCLSLTVCVLCLSVSVARSLSIYIRVCVCVCVCVCFFVFFSLLLFFPLAQWPM